LVHAYCYCASNLRHATSYINHALNLVPRASFPLISGRKNGSSGSNHFRHAPQHAIDADWDCAVNPPLLFPKWLRLFMGISEEIDDAIAIDETTKRRFRNYCSHGNLRRK